jgi:hypothetical protein
LPLGQGDCSDEERTRISAGMARHMARRIVEELRLMAQQEAEGAGSGT